MATPCIPFNIRPLDCATDSITVCALEPLQVVVSGIGTAATPDQWAINDAPAAAIAASTTRAAVVGQRHRATAVSIIVTAESATAPTATNLTVTLRDGSSGVGPILMIWRVHIAADMLSENIAEISLVGLNVVGTVNTPMTLEFNAGVINILEVVNLTGYTAA